MLEYQDKKMQELYGKQMVDYEESTIFTVNTLIGGAIGCIIGFVFAILLCKFLF